MAAPFLQGPSAPILTIPQGLLGLLQLKETGKLPATLGEVVGPNLDLFQMYAERLAVSAIGLFGGNPQTAAITTGLIGFRPFLLSGSVVTVPQNEMWYVTQVCATIVTGAIAAADTFRGGPCWATSNQSNLPGVGSDVYMMSNNYQDAVTARNRGVATDPSARPFFVPPGAGFYMAIEDALSATSIAFQLALRAARLPI